MQAQLVKPRDPALIGLVESFLFQRAGDSVGEYTTFPNTNLCLALYLGNEARWDRATNRCSLERSTRPWSSKLYGFHQQPFHVAWQGPVRQVNILFRPGALARFTRMPVRLIDAVDDPHTEIFGKQAADLIEQLFNSPTVDDQVRCLETFLRAHLLPMSTLGTCVESYLEMMARPSMDTGPSLQVLARRTCTSPSTIYRSFMQVIGQAPQAFFNTVRFRQALSAIMSGEAPGTSIALDNGYFDQAHFIKDMQRFAGASPRGIRRNAHVVPGGFVWVRP